MPEGLLINLTVIVVLLALSAFFSSSEAAYLSLERVTITRMELDIDLPKAASRLSGFIAWAVTRTGAVKSCGTPVRLSTHMGWNTPSARTPSPP